MRLLLLILVIAPFTAFSFENDVKQSLENIENKSFYSCASKESIRSVYSPPEMLPVVIRCMRENKIFEAVYYYMVASAFAHYDTQRVSNPNAREIIIDLKLKNLWNNGTEIKEQFLSQSKAIRSNEDMRSTSCKFLIELGKPDYDPEYLLVNANELVGESSRSKLTPGLNLDEIWKDTLKEYMECDL